MPALQKSKANRLKPILLELLRGRRTVRSRACACIPQENPRSGRRDGAAEVCSRRIERDVASVGADCRGRALAIGLRSIAGDGNSLCRRSAARFSSRASIPDENIRHTVRIAIHQIRRRGNKRHVAPIRADRRRNTVSISGVAGESNGSKRHRRRAARGSTVARIAHKNVFSRARRLGNAIGRSKHKCGVAGGSARDRQR